MYLLRIHVINVDNRWRIVYKINEVVKEVEAVMRKMFSEKYNVMEDSDGAIVFWDNVVFHKEIDRKIKRAVDYIREVHDNAERVAHGIRR